MMIIHMKGELTMLRHEVHGMFEMLQQDISMHSANMKSTFSQACPSMAAALSPQLPDKEMLLHTKRQATKAALNAEEAAQRAHQRHELTEVRPVPSAREADSGMTPETAFGHSRELMVPDTIELSNTTHASMFDATQDSMSLERFMDDGAKTQEIAALLPDAPTAPPVFGPATPTPPGLGC